MKLNSRVSLFVVALLFSAVEMRAQESGQEKLVRPRVVAQEVKKPLPPTPAPEAKPADVSPRLPIVVEEVAKKPAGPVTHLTPSVIQARISEARRMLKTRPVATAMSVPSIQFVTIAALDRETGRTHFITVSKETFLTKGAQISALSSEGVAVNVTIVRANGVNTALTVFTPEGKSLAPLTIEYPIEKGGQFK